MTIIIGALHQGKAFIGTDSLWNWTNSFVREMKTSKFLPLQDDSILIAGSGEERLSQIFVEILNSKENQHLLELETLEDVITLGKELQEAVNDAGVGGSKDNEMPDHNMGFLIIKEGINKLWLLESDYSVLEYDDYVCLGAGGEQGECAMRVLCKNDTHGEKAVQLAIEAVNEIHPFCGGRIEIRSVSTEPVDDDVDNSEKPSQKPGKASRSTKKK